MRSRTEYMRDYQRRYKAEHGFYPGGSTGTCQHCGAGFRTRTRAQRFCSGVCTAAATHGPDRTIKRLNTPRWNAARKKLAKAAAGKRSGWIWTQGTCRKCGAWFTRSGRPSPFCSSGCSRKDRAVRRIRERTSGLRLTEARRLEVHERFEWICYLCGIPVNRKATSPEWDFAVVDHVVALARGGSNCPENWATAHHLCNSQKRDLSVDEFWQRYPLKKVHARLVLELAQVAS